MLSLTDAAIISTILEAILYGFSILMFIFTLWIVLQNRRRRRLSFGMVSAACAILLLSSAEMIVNIMRVRQGFLTVGPHLPGGSEQFFGDVSTSTFVIKSCLYNTQTLILDGVVIYRTYVVWQNLWIVVLPILGWCGLLAASIGLNVALATASAQAGDVFAVGTGRWITANYAITLATNLTSTSLLAYRIWKVKQQSARFSSANNPLSSILRVVIESGAIYSVTITTALVAFVSKSNGVYVVLDMISPIISIVFNMITVRVGLASDQRLSAPGTLHQSAFSTEVRAGINHNHPYSRCGQSLAVEITQYIEQDNESIQETPITPTTLKPDSVMFSSVPSVAISQLEP
ncbi:hypothetical protein PHLGIDRAFT_131166 [Phlebiopsis gigantea 11061_1 CR5-6]|uniref:Uncharacterized protein n=1 Tax=Phlebiopsis gigantea (strain 11061_1 CR5-6) TaxID=745531 RepID=A0A0C3PA48_PHLG1|nr:hypothetical protein PHLGIDRAFT_131166 [Phlebiopsis gigantea 11061_1 CR5-6]